MSLADRLVLAREHAGLTQRQLAARCEELGNKISAGQIAKLESGSRANPRASDVSTIAEATGVRHRWLLAGEGPMPDVAETPEAVGAFEGAVSWFLATETHEGRGDAARAFLGQRRQENAGAERLSPDAWLAKLRDEFRAFRAPSKVVGVREVDPDDDEDLRPPKINARRR